jgi:hypothetical protein
MCLLSPSTRELAVESGTLDILLGKLEADIVDGTIAGACLDALLALLADSNINQTKFLNLGGVNKVGPCTAGVRHKSLSNAEVRVKKVVVECRYLWMCRAR